MEQAIKNLLMWVLLLAVSPLAANPAGTGMAEVVTQVSRPADCLAAVAINRVDGRPRTLPAKGFLITPGFHTLNGRAKLDITHCPFTDSGQRIGGADDLEASFEAGRTYYIGYDHKPANSEEWKLVIWKVE